jgi:hypothetical protein
MKMKKQIHFGFLAPWCVPFVALISGCLEMQSYDAPVTVVGPTIRNLAAITPTATFVDTAAADNPEAVVRDGRKNLVVAGRTLGTLTGTNAGYQDVFIRKYDSAGSVLWTQQIGSAGNDAAYSMGVDASNNLYIGGEAGAAFPGATFMGGTDYFLLKYDPDGNLLYTVQAGTATSDRLTQLMVAPSGEVYAYGRTAGALDGETNQGGNDCFLVKYDTSGTRVWTKLFGTTASDSCFTAARTSTDDIYVTFSTTSSYGGTNQGGSDIVIVKVDSNGAVQWSKMIGGSLNESIYGSTTDASGNLYITGPTNSDLGGTNANTGTNDVYVAKILSAATVAWITQYGGSGDEEGDNVSVTDSGYVYVTGFSNGTLNGITTRGNYDPFLADFDPSGVFHSLFFDGGTGVDTGRRLAVASDESEAYLGGSCVSADGSFFDTPCVATASFTLKFTGI